MAQKQCLSGQKESVVTTRKKTKQNNKQTNKYSLPGKSREVKVEARFA